MIRPANILTSTAAAAALMASTIAFAADDVVTFGPETYSVEEFETDRFIGTLDIIVEDRATIEISASGLAEHMNHLEVNADGDSVEVTYDDPRRRRNAWSRASSWWHNDDDRLEEFPTVTVRLPAGTTVDLDGMVGELNAGDLNGPFRLAANGSLIAEVGDVASADIQGSGSGRVELGDIAGALQVANSGSGDLTAGSSNSAEVRNSGSSDIDLGAIALGLDARMSGSGDLSAASVNGPVSINLSGSGNALIDGGNATGFEVSTSGSGDIRFEGSTTSASLQTRGSGEIELERVNGPVEINTTGSGDVSIDEGRAEGLQVTIRGSGDVDFGGTAVNAITSVTGSGDLHIDTYEGRTSSRRTGG